MSGTIILRMPLGDRLATAEGKRAYVRTLFATIADRYDLITRVLSYGQDARWKRHLIERIARGEDQHGLDLATGTGDLAFLAAARGLTVVGADLTLRMAVLARAKRQATQRSPVFVVGDMEALPFPSAFFDVVTVGYGLRNVADLPLALAEIHRVLKPEGQLLSLDFNRPRQPLVRALYLTYLSVVGGALGWWLHRDADTYRYIPVSIRRYPGAEGVAALMSAQGFRQVTYSPLLGGLMAIHEARK